MTRSKPANESARERKAIAGAIARLTKAASRPSRKGDARGFLALGGVVALPDRQYIEEFLDLVNESMAADYSNASVVAKVFRGDSPSDVYLPPAERDSLLQFLDRIRKDPDEIAQEFKERWGKILHGRVASIPDNDVAIGSRTIIVGSDAAWTYVLKRLTEEPFRDELCRCEWSECRRLFLYRFERTGGPPLYHSKDCSKAAERQKNAERQAARRRGLSVSVFRGDSKSSKKTRRSK